MAYGTLLAVVLYVFEFSETASRIPETWQEYLRLRDILGRLDRSAVEGPAAATSRAGGGHRARPGARS